MLIKKNRVIGIPDWMEHNLTICVYLKNLQILWMT